MTKTLVISIEPIVDELGDRSANGSHLVAFDKATGELVARVEVDRSLHGGPMTYLHEGRQYILIAGGGERPGPGPSIASTAIADAPPRPPRQPPRKSELLAFALPR